MPTTNCKTCGKEFYAKPSHVQNGLGKYCSKNCSHEGARKGRIVKCSICGREIYKQQKALTKSKSNTFFCGKSCRTIWRNSIVYIGKNHPNWKGGKHVSYKNILTKSTISSICTLCGNNDKRVLAVHHIDKNHRNNDLKNLAWLCHNCHILVHNHKKEEERFLKILHKKTFQ